MARLFTRAALLAIVAFSYILVFTALDTKDVVLPYTPPPPVGKDFINSIFNQEYNFRKQHEEWKVENDNTLVNIRDVLKFNTIQVYDWFDSPEFGTFNEPLNQTQIDNMNNLMNKTESHDLKGIYERLKISRLCYGQRVVYEVSGLPDATDVNYGFAYQTNMMNTYQTDNGRTVLHASPGYNAQGYLCRDILENYQHSDQFDFRQTEGGIWHMKPVMRIPLGIDDEALVVRIDIIPFGSGNPVHSIDIKGLNFKNEGYYNGEYLDKYFSLPGLGLQISGNRESGSLNQGWNSHWWNWNTTEMCNVDFRVWWYGQVEVWFDKMVVDDEMADKLFQGFHDPKIEDEVSNFTNHPANYTFFTDECAFSQIPCLKYVQQKMKQYNSNAKLCFAASSFHNVRGMKNSNLQFRVFLDSLKPERFQVDSHEFFGWRDENGVYHYNYIPQNSLNQQEIDPKFPDGWKTDNITYNNWLQNDVYGDKNSHSAQDPTGSFIWQVQKARDQVNQYSTETKLIIQAQIHGYLFQVDQENVYDNGIREPLNEEIQAQAMIALAHGADGLSWYIYHTDRWRETHSSSPYDSVFQYGLLTMPHKNDPILPRTHNMYGQDKWNYVSSMNSKLLAWKPTLDQIKYYSGFSVHSETPAHHYISDIKSIYRDPDAPFDFIPTNEDAVRYWEMGFFNSMFNSDFGQYFIMVNRRCVPETWEGSGDLRQLKIKFNGTYLPEFNNWKLIDLTTKQTITTFNKNSTSYYLVGAFQPGEGKLFKLEPVL